MATETATVSNRTGASPRPRASTFLTFLPQHYKIYLFLKRECLTPSLSSLRGIKRRSARLFPSLSNLMGPKTTYLLTTLGFLGIVVIMLVAVKAEAPFVLGGIGGFLKAFVIISSREGKQRELGLWTMVGITVFALIAGLIYGAFLEIGRASCRERV